VAHCLRYDRLLFLDKGQVRHGILLFLQIVDLPAPILMLGHIIPKAVSLGAILAPLSTLLVLQLARSA
jgi:hypothetical protein